MRRPLQSFIPCLLSLLVTVKLKPEIIFQGDRELIVNMTILELERPIYDAPDKQTHLLTDNVNVSDSNPFQNDS